MAAADLRRAFADRGGLQCGYCTPGFIVRCHEMLETVGADEGDRGAAVAGAAAPVGEAAVVGPGPKTEVAAAGAVSEAAVRAGLSGNFCRCTGYNGSVAAVVDSLSR